MRRFYNSILLRVRSRSLEWMVVLFTGFVLIVSLTSLDLYLYRSGISPIIPSALSFVLLVILVTFNILIDYLTRPGNICLKALFRIRPVLFSFSILVFISLAYALAPDAYWEHEDRYIKLYIQLIAVFIMGAMVVVTPGFIKHYRKIFFICAMALNISIITDVLSPGYFYGVKAIYRASGFIENPNEACLIATLLTICAVDWKDKSLFNIVIFIFSGIAVFATLSRSGLAIYLFTILYYIKANSNWKIFLRKKNPMIMLFAIVIFFGVVDTTNMLSLGEGALLQDDTAYRAIGALMNVFNPDDTGATDNIRVDLFYYHLDLIADRPVVGYGMKYYLNTNLGSHNIFLSQWLEYGILGLISVLAFLWITYLYFKQKRDLRGKAFVIIFIMSGFFSHNMFDSHALIIMLALLSGLAGIEHSLMRANQQNSSTP
jgi:O-antigen ligase